MRILLIHNAYRQHGGEDAVVEAERSLLHRHGEQVLLYRRHNDELADLGRLDMLGKALWNRAAAAEIAGLCRRFAPDVVHVHNTFPLISPAVLHQLADDGVPVVQTLHNFRLMCTQAMFLREGKVCEDCLGHLPWRAVTRACYHGSHAESAAAASVQILHRLARTYTHKVTLFVAASGFVRDKYLLGGLPSERILVKPHFTAQRAPVAQPRLGGLFLGRLSPEKGLGLLHEALARVPGAQVRVAGSGPLDDEARRRFGSACLGQVPAARTAALLQEAAWLVAPSLCYETFGMNIIEAFAAGTPVIASGHGAYAELVRDGHTGLLFAPGDAADLARAIAWAEAHPAAMRRMGQAARAEHAARYTPERNYRLLRDIYEHAIRQHRPPPDAPAPAGPIHATRDRSAGAARPP